MWPIDLREQAGAFARKLDWVGSGEQGLAGQRVKYSLCLVFQYVWWCKPGGWLSQAFCFSQHRRAEFPSPREDILKHPSVNRFQMRDIKLADDWCPLDLVNALSCLGRFKRGQLLSAAKAGDVSKDVRSRIQVRVRSGVHSTRLLRRQVHRRRSLRPRAAGRCASNRYPNAGLRFEGGRL